MQVVLLGAGASKSYNRSPVGERMPLARDFFETFNRLRLAGNPWVLIDKLCGYIIEIKDADPYTYLSSGIDIEELHSEIADYVETNKDDFLKQFVARGAYTQLVFIFATVINEIQNGPISPVHRRIAKCLSDRDSVITFNWDTLMDRALSETGWSVNTGYGIVPHAIFRDGWSDPITNNGSAVKIHKLHGSTNWLTGYPLNLDNKILLGHALDPGSVFVYEWSEHPYDTYDGRFMGGYEPFSYGYYPPNLMDVPGIPAKEGHTFVQVTQHFSWSPRGTSGKRGIVSMPLIIPPVKEKSYELFGELFKSIWNQAEEDLVSADHIAIIGYSFPRTDDRSNELFRQSFARRTTVPVVSIVNPDPEYVANKFLVEFGIPQSNIRIFRDYLTENFPIEKLLADEKSGY